MYFLTLFVALVLLPQLVTYSPGALASHQHQVWLWTFTSNWAQPFGADVSGFSHFWSLAVEEQFYLVWPFVVLLAAGTRLLWICVALVLIALLSRAFMQVAGAKPEMIYMFTFCRMDALAMGAAMAVVSLSAPAMQWITGHTARCCSRWRSACCSPWRCTRTPTRCSIRTPWCSARHCSRRPSRCSS